MWIIKGINMTKRIIEVVWDIDNDEAMSNIDLYAEMIDELGLPQFVTVSDDIADDDIANHISDEFGYCIYELYL